MIAHTAIVPVRLIAVLVLAFHAPAQWVGEWPLDSTSGTTAVDLSGNGNNGTLLNFGVAAWQPGVYGNSLSFDGVDDHVLTSPQGPLYDGLGTPYSICYWVKAPAQLNAFVYAEGRPGGSAILIFGSGQYAPTQDRFRTYCRNDQGDVPFTGVSNAVVYDDTWHHVAFVDNCGEITLYVDGVLDGGGIAYDPMRLPGSPGHGTYTMTTAAMGALVRGTVCCNMVGSVDDLRIYDFAMTQTDVAVAMAGAPLLPPSASLGNYGVGCGAGPFDMVGGGSAAIGGPGIQLRLQAGSPGGLTLLVAGLGDVAPVDLGVAGFAGCTLYPANFATAFVGVLDANGDLGPIPFGVPNNPSLAAQQLNCQGVALDPATSALEFSNAVLAMLGF